MATMLVISRANTYIALNPRFADFLTGAQRVAKLRTLCMLVCDHRPRIMGTNCVTNLQNWQIKPSKFVIKDRKSQSCVLL